MKIQHATKSIPNLISAARGLSLPFLGVAFLQWNVPMIFFCLVFFVLTDILDGYLARRLDAESRFGNLLDHTVDRLGQGVGILALLYRNVIPWWFVVGYLGLIVLRGGVYLYGAAMTSGVPEDAWKRKIPLRGLRVSMWYIGACLVVFFPASTWINSVYVVLLMNEVFVLWYIRLYVAEAVRQYPRRASSTL